MKNYLIDVAVKTTIWTRPDCQRKQFEVIKEARPSKLLLVSDGGRTEEEWRRININRRMFDEEIDWDCEVYKLYEEENRGVWTMINRGHKFVWSKVDACIFLEDDDIPTVTFFAFCKEMLDRYKNDTRIGMICGTNLLGIYEDCPYDYFFTGSGSIWGVATWKRITESFDMSYRKDAYEMKILKRKLRGDAIFWKSILSFGKTGYYNNHIATDEFFYGMSRYANSQLRIVPTRNMISNVGCTADSAHSGAYETIPHALRKIFSLPRYDVKFPLSHPRYVTEDLIFEQRVNSIMAYNMPVKSAIRRLEKIYLYSRKKGELKKGMKRWYNRVIRKKIVK